MLKFVVKTANLSLVFTENQHLTEFSQIREVSFQHTKREDFYTHKFKGVMYMLWFQDISFWNQSFEDYPHEKQVSPKFHWFVC